MGNETKKTENLQSEFSFQYSKTNRNYFVEFSTIAMEPASMKVTIRSKNDSLTRIPLLKI